MAEGVVAPLKRCSKCNVELPATDDFYEQFSNKGVRGLRGACKKCRGRKEYGPALRRSMSDDERRIRQKETARRSYLKHREKRLAENKAWAAAHPGYEKQRWPKRREKSAEYKRRRLAEMTEAERAEKRRKLDEWRAANPDKTRKLELARMARISADPALREKEALKQREWRKKSPKYKERLAETAEQRAEYNRNWRERNPEKIEAAEKLKRERRKTDPNYIAQRRARDSNRRTRSSACRGKHTGKDIQRLLAGQSAQCFYCGQSIENLKFEIDHFIPLSKRGSNEPDNLVLSCCRCNRSKGAKFPWEWMPDRFSAP